MGIQLIKGTSQTGTLLESALREQGASLERPFDAVVNYGQRTFPQGLPGLNVAPYPENKLEELRTLNSNGVQIVPLLVLGPLGLEPEDYPIFGRKLEHSKGKDIIPILGPTELAWALASGNVDYFTRYISLSKEFRCWVFRGTVLATYEKFLHEPSRYHTVGCNSGNGFAFTRVSPTPQGVKTLALGALRALRLDFGAVDILVDREGTPWVLEVNRQPGASGERRSGLWKLARKITEWQEAGYSLRRERAI